MDPVLDAGLDVGIDAVVDMSSQPTPPALFGASAGAGQNGQCHAHARGERTQKRPGRSAGALGVPGRFL
jgi:hypothetical protein